MNQNGNQYCISLTDYFSKWAEAVPIPTKEAHHIASFLYKMTLRHGCPQEIVSDQGREFCNKLVDALEDLTGFKHKNNEYTAQCSGYNELYHVDCLGQTVLPKLCIEDSQGDWYCDCCL